MNGLPAVLLLSALSLTACSKQVSPPAVSKGTQPAVSQEPKHGYELAKTWDNATAQAKMDEAENYYTNGLTRFGKTDSQLARLRVALATYKSCVTGASLESLCQAYPPRSAEGIKACADCKPGPKQLAECNRIIDLVPKLIEQQNSGVNADWKR